MGYDWGASVALLMGLQDSTRKAPRLSQLICFMPAYGGKNRPADEMTKMKR